VQTAPKSAVHTKPTTHPEFLNASGIAKIPVPIFPFNKWIMVSKFLNKKKKINIQNKPTKYIYVWTEI